MCMWCLCSIIFSLSTGMTSIVFVVEKKWGLQDRIFVAGQLMQARYITHKIYTVKLYLTVIALIWSFSPRSGLPWPEAKPAHWGQTQLFFKALLMSYYFFEKRQYHSLWKLWVLFSKEECHSPIQSTYMFNSDCYPMKSQRCKIYQKLHFWQS